MEVTQTSSDGDLCPGISSVQQKRTGSAEPSYVSMKSSQSMDPPLRLNDGNKCSSVHQKRTESAEPSCVFMKSDQCMDPPLRFDVGNMPSGCSYRRAIIRKPKGIDERNGIFVSPKDAHGPRKACDALGVSHVKYH
ncbi:hypothetical protein G5714_015408 [Onychostoma macrolepis]|uniref:Uncharacterized protein n=1 Tax=Onychostoma macrolepis TaxID=369639 RepID=A0A7J6CBG6_9TELE|nr:hypothetical protein G5714_015408 [Onychostoma macrolepis]